MPLQTEAFTHSSFYSEKPLNRAAFTHTHRSFYTEKILHREAFSQTSVCGKELWAMVFTYSSFHSEKPCADRLLHSGLFSQSSVYEEQLLHTEALTQRGLYTERLLRTEVFTRKLYTEKLYTEKRLNRASFIHRSIYTHKSFTYTQSFYTQTLLRIEACSQMFTELTGRRFDAERPLHRAAFTHRRFYTEMHRAAFAYRPPRLLRTEGFTVQCFTHKLCTDKLLHREASTQSILYTQKHLFTHTHTQKLYRHAFTHRAFTHRCFYA